MLVVNIVNSRFHHKWGEGFLSVRALSNRRITEFPPLVYRSCRYMEWFLFKPEVAPHPVQVRRNRTAAPRTNSRRAPGVFPPGAAGFMEPQSISNQPMGSGFHTAPGGIDPGDRSFCPRFVGDVDAWNYLLPGEGTLSSPAVVDFMNPSQSAMSQ